MRAATRAATLVLLAIALSGCDLVAGPPSAPRLGQTDGSRGLIVGIGELDGRQWVGTVAIEGDSLCTALTLAGERNPSGSCTTVPRSIGVFGARGESSGGGLPTFISGTVGDQVAFVEVHSSVGLTTVETFSLAPLGAPGRGYSLALREGAMVETLVAVDQAGNELGVDQVAQPDPPH